MIQNDGCSCAGIPSGEPDCDNIIISTSDSTITVTGLDQSPISKLKIFDENWNTIFDCFGNCQGTEVITVPEGNYNVKVALRTSSWQEICEREEDVYVSNGGNPCTNSGGDTDNDGICNDLDNCPSEFNPNQEDSNGNGIGDTCEESNEGPCADINVFATNGELLIEGIDSVAISKVQVFNSSWQIIYSCFNDCSPYPSIPISDGLYYVRVAKYSANWQPICEELFDINISNGSGTAQTRVESSTHSFFQANKQGRSVRLYWKNNIEFSNQHFVIERSSDNINFASIETTEIIHTNNYYQTDDDAPLKGDNYYRIKTILSDGSHQYTASEKVSFSINLSDFSLYPNPTNDLIHISMIDLEGLAAKVSIYNSLGTPMYQSDLPAVLTAPYTIDIHHFPAGIYTLVIKPGPFRLISRYFVVSK